MSEINVTPISGDFGARITGVDLTRTLTEGQVADIVAAIDQFGVLVFPEQPVDQQQQVAFTKISDRSTMAHRKPSRRFRRG